MVITAVDTMQQFCFIAVVQM